MDSKFTVKLDVVPSTCYTTTENLGPYLLLPVADSLLHLKKLISYRAEQILQIPNGEFF